MSLLELLAARVAYLGRDGLPVSPARLYAFLAARIAIKEIHAFLDRAVAGGYIIEIFIDLPKAPDGRIERTRMFGPGYRLCFEERHFKLRRRAA